METPVSNQNVGSTNALDKLDRMIYLLERIEKYYYPPLWKRALLFTFMHLTTIVGLIFLAFFTWQIWGTVNAIQSSFGNAGNTFQNLQQNAADQINRIRNNFQ